MTSGGPTDGDQFLSDLTRSRKFVLAVAGPNGAGKSTFVAMKLGPLPLQIINPDAIARDMRDAGAPPESVDVEAAKEADARRRRFMSDGDSFGFETVFSDRGGKKVEFLRELQAKGYVVFLVFIGLQDSAVSVARVFQRTQEGGHDVPDDVISNRFPRTLQNLAAAVQFVDHVFVFDNSLNTEPYRFVAKFEKGRLVRRGYWPEWAEFLTA